MKILFLFSLAFFSAFSATLEEKVGATIVCPIFGEEINERMKDFLREVKPGGIILYNWTNDLSSREKTLKLISDLQQEAIANTGYPLLIWIDQEGGRVQRIPMGISTAQELGNSPSTENAYSAGKTIGKKLSSLGIHVNTAPVVDVNSNPNNTVIGSRSFSSDANAVTKFATAFAKGLNEEGIFPCLKHFPGHGDVSQDSHYTLPVSQKTLEELFHVELVPYTVLCSTTSFIMTSHIFFPEVDPLYPVTLSSIFIQDILRNKLNYKGIIVTDSLRMDGIATKPMDEIGVQAFNAGHDILLLGGNRLIEKDPSLNDGDVREFYYKLLIAAKEGKLSSQRLEESFARIQKIRDLLVAE